MRTFDFMIKSTIKTEWKEQFKDYKYKIRIYCDRRKRFYRMKLYLVPEEIAIEALKIAKRYNENSYIESVKHWSTMKKKVYNCIVKIDYY
jgi:hypothetical protein